MKRLGWLLRWHNIKIAPVVLLARLPVMLVGLTLAFMGEAICKFGNGLPGFKEFP